MMLAAPQHGEMGHGVLQQSATGSEGSWEEEDQGLAHQGQATDPLWVLAQASLQRQPLPERRVRGAAGDQAGGAAAAMYPQPVRLPARRRTAPASPRPAASSFLYGPQRGGTRGKLRPFSKEEDAKILAEMAKGVTKWSVIATRLPGRSSKQIRERYLNHLDPVLIHTPWTPREDGILAHMQHAMGNRWSEMQSFLPGRSENSIKNRWNAAGGPRAALQKREVVPWAPETPGANARVVVVNGGGAESGVLDPPVKQFAMEAVVAAAAAAEAAAAPAVGAGAEDGAFCERSIVLRAMRSSDSPLKRQRTGRDELAVLTGIGVPTAGDVDGSASLSPATTESGSSETDERGLAGAT